jgi:hypothetical protein
MLDRAAPACDRRPVRRAPRPRVPAAALAIACLALCACGSLDSPTVPEPTPDPRPPTAVAPAPNPNPTPTPILGGPAPQPSPTPDPGASPGPSPSPGAPGDAGGCGAPLPPPLATLVVTIHQRGDNRWLLDSTPVVGPDPDYCAKIGFTDGRRTCPVRTEGHPEREACELYVTGRASDTGRAGPTWSVDGAPCTGVDSCLNHESNQYQVFAYKNGLYRACGKNSVCGQTAVSR